MKILFFVYYANLISGLIIPFRQSKNGLFLFFIFAAVADPCNIALHTMFYTDSNISTYVYYVLSYMISVYYLKKKSFGLSYSVIAIALIILIPLLSYNVLFNAQSQAGTQILFGLTGLCILLVLCNIFILMMENIYATGRINLYFVFLVLLHLLMLLRIGTLALRFDAGIAYFVVSLFIETVIGMYYIFYDIENSPQIMLLRKYVRAEHIEL